MWLFRGFQTVDDKNNHIFSVFQKKRTAPLAYYAPHIFIFSVICISLPMIHTPLSISSSILTKMDEKFEKFNCDLFIKNNIY